MLVVTFTSGGSEEGTWLSGDIYRPYNHQAHNNNYMLQHPKYVTVRIHVKRR